MAYRRLVMVDSRAIFQPYGSTQPINYLSRAFDEDVAAERAFNTQNNYRASTGEYNSTAFAHMGTRFLTPGSGGLDSDILESHDFQPASPHRHHQHNSFPSSGYSPPVSAPTRNPGAHQSASGRPMYSPMPGVGSDHAETHGTPEQSSPPLGTLRNRKAYTIRGEPRGVYEPTLDWRYQVQRPPGDFFVVGRVFAILWHEGKGQQGTVISQGTVIPDFNSLGRSTQNQFTRGRFGEEIFSGIRRMVVVKAMSQCAWCVPITTYGGKGVAKPGVDPAKHAIVYMRGSVPTCKADEPRMTKEPLEVEPARPDERLDEMSRLNFGKVYTVEHNVKVRNVGMISRISMVKFRGYASNEFRLDI
ncbi:hypothetical protein Asppvi_007978 [Aspergillus pseudoviridinutans]|uniref:DUF6590 domain-containing protein n=1 Tax=Aspergillus pseudoviridinutans TaxID=1517512 RepID=A0A9P3EUZ1_9EURO|nr:uncharacterized protein Asppvi_007978 [Aspergillus pseudoviridinutans]GIJ89049.1 hypothetical protein Asppvi_007978 [Aspergillus pseudoviridinutans]